MPWFEVDWIKTQGEIAHRHRRFKNRDPNKTQYVWTTRFKHNKRGIVTFQVTIMFGLRFVRFLAIILNIVGLFLL